MKYEKKYNLKINLFGFDTFEGMPKSENINDQLYDWKQGDFYANYELIQKKLKFTTLIKGNVEDTISQNIFEKHKISNILIIFFDLDYYSSTSSAFKIFDKVYDKYILPRVGLFFDNLHSATEISGEYLSIKNFNKNNFEFGKYISKDFYLERFDNRYYIYLNQNHKNYSINYNEQKYL